MKKHYVSLETAKKLKEKGHREVVTHFYRDEKLTPCISIHAKESIDEINGIANLTKWGYSAPELHEVQQWLREEYNIHIIIYKNACGYGYELCKADNGTFICHDYIKGYNDAGLWDKYEESLEAGINEVLNLI